MEKSAFKKCSVEIAKNLDIIEITPYLNACELLTENDLQVLINEVTTPAKKANHLLYALPRKANFFEKFLDCLDKTKDATGHKTIYDALLNKYNELKKTDRDLKIILKQSNSLQITSQNKRYIATYIILLAIIYAVGNNKGDFSKTLC